MVVGILRVELLLFSPCSLKEKRGIVRSILGRCRSQLPVSCAETGLHDLWQRAELGFTMVERSEAAVQAVFQRVEDVIDRSGLAEVAERYVEYLHY